MKTSREFRELCDLLAQLEREGKIKVTFSEYCISGYVGRGVCQCWRCDEWRRNGGTVTLREIYV